MEEPTPRVHFNFTQTRSLVKYFTHDFLKDDDFCFINTISPRAQINSNFARFILLLFVKLVSHFVLGEIRERNWLQGICSYKTQISLSQIRSIERPSRFREIHPTLSLRETPGLRGWVFCPLSPIFLLSRKPGCLRCASLTQKILPFVFRVTGVLSTNAPRPSRCASRRRRLARCIHLTFDSAPLARCAAARGASSQCFTARVVQWRVLVGRGERSSYGRRVRISFHPLNTFNALLPLL